MNSPFLSAIGMGGVDLGILVILELLVIIGLIVVVVMLFNKYNKMIKKYDKFMRGSTARSMENQIIDMCEDQRFLKQMVENNQNQIADLYKKHAFAIQKIGMVKYDAYHESGGKLSSVLCLLDENNNGFIINSVHSTSGCFSYLKRVKKGVSDITLGKEEQVSLDRAMKVKSKNAVPDDETVNI